MSTFAAASSAATNHGCADRVGRYNAGDLRRPQGLARVSELLAAEGLALFRDVHTRTAVLQAASAILTVRRHPDADPDGVTVITDLGATGDLPGAAGFSRRELGAHTDGSRAPEPPGLLMAVCLQPAAVGGASTFTDGLAVVGELASNWPQALAALARPRSVLFGRADGYLGAVLTVVPAMAAATIRLQLRLRLDDLVTFAPDLQPWLPTLEAAIARHAISVPLVAGQGYILDNHRWLHAREEFTGTRTLYRVLGDPLPSLGLHPGIPAALEPLVLAGDGSVTSARSHS